MEYQEYVTLVNRTSKALKGTWDGRRSVYDANKKYSVPRAVAEAARDQNPVMGSEDRETGKMQYLLGIEEDADDCSPIEQSGSLEKYDFSAARNGEKPAVIKGDRGFLGRVAGELPLDGAFVKP